jgi:hypothetical protein
VCKPSQEDFEATDKSMILDLMAESLAWDPTDDRFGQDEEAMVDSTGKLRDDLSPHVVAAL